MKRINLILTIIFCAVSMGFTQNNIQDPKAKAILDGVSAKMKTYASYQVEFKQTMENKKEKINETFSAKLLVKGEKYNLTVSQQIVICDGKTVWTYLKDANEVTIDDPSNKEDALNPSSVFTLWEKGYKYKFIKEEIQAGTAVQIIDLTPIKTKSFYKVRLIIDKNKKQIISSSVYEKSGTSYTFKILKFTPNAAPSDASFVFNKASYPGVEVIDNR